MAECMTPEERAGKVSGAYQFPQGVENHIADAIAAAVAEEREACAKVVEAQPILGIFSSDYTGKIAAAIRARSEGGGCQTAVTSQELIDRGQK